jgi:hypothetical protein
MNAKEMMNNDVDACALIGLSIAHNCRTSYVSFSLSSPSLPQDNMNVGSCWPMSGSDGFVTIGLRERIIPRSISLQHISSAIAPDHTTTPKEFTIWVSHARGHARMRSRS